MTIPELIELFRTKEKEADREAQFQAQLSDRDDESIGRANGAAAAYEFCRKQLEAANES